MSFNRPIDDRKDQGSDRGGQIKHFRCINDSFMDICNFKIVRRVRSIFRKVVNICGLPSDDFLLKQGSICLLLSTHLLKFYSWKNNIYKNYNNLMSNWDGTLLLTMVNYFNELIN